jgi:hypothetical protein
MNDPVSVKAKDVLVCALGSTTVYDIAKAYCVIQKKISLTLNSLTRFFSSPVSLSLSMAAASCGVDKI